MVVLEVKNSHQTVVKANIEKANDLNRIGRVNSENTANHIDVNDDFKEFVYEEREINDRLGIADQTDYVLCLCDENVNDSDVKNTKDERTKLECDQNQEKNSDPKSTNQGSNDVDHGRENPIIGDLNEDTRNIINHDKHIELKHDDKSKLDADQKQDGASKNNDDHNLNNPVNSDLNEEIRNILNHDKNIEFNHDGKAEQDGDQNQEGASNTIRENDTKTSNNNDERESPVIGDPNEEIRYVINNDKYMQYKHGGKVNLDDITDNADLNAHILRNIQKHDLNIYDNDDKETINKDNTQKKSGDENEYHNDKNIISSESVKRRCYSDDNEQPPTAMDITDDDMEELVQNYYEHLNSTVNDVNTTTKTEATGSESTSGKVDTPQTKVVLRPT